MGRIRFGRLKLENIFGANKFIVYAYEKKESKPPGHLLEVL